MASTIVAITYFAVLLGLGVLIANVFKKRNIPDTIFLILLGLVLGPTILGNPAVSQYVKMVPIDVVAMGAVPDFLRILALILIVFTGMFNLGFRVFKKSSGMAIKFAILGVFANTALIGVAAHFIFGLDWVFALLLGAVLSGTADAIIFTFDAVLKDYKRSLSILKSEAVFNSPVAILVPLIFLDLVALQPGALLDPMLYFTRFVQMIIAGVGAGILLGIAFSKLAKRVMQEYTVLLLLSIALLTYVAAEYVGGSGILAVAVCGLIVGDIAFPERDDARRFDDHFSEMLRIAVFTLLGAQVTLMFSFTEVVMIIIFFIVVIMARPLIILPLMGRERKNYTRQELTVLSFVAPRGIDSAVMAPIVAAALIATSYVAEASQILSIVVMVIILTVMFSTVVAKMVGSKRFTNGQMSMKNYTGGETQEEMEEELEDEIEHEEERPSPQQKEGRRPMDGKRQDSPSGTQTPSSEKKAPEAPKPEKKKRN